ncbi:MULTISPECIES: hypothetical protein [unclassified Massilia]|uniref:hypothetical protein n=1 Tax=unclassified Massilia TaxID=2609279 RepID=UPI00177F3882|nr:MULTISPECIES: hypothetical protein [unclassified Massilia]MBD8531206.1 hypothetical protein [Massilia sp. CFBP 13647]MBD8675042.1 hypothetical protein [Massilia sp. CFBP 13721]
MSWFMQLLRSSYFLYRRKSRQALSRRAAEVITKVLFDMGIDRFLDGSLLVDHGLRLRFVSRASNVQDASVYAAVRAASLVQAHALRQAQADAGWAAPPRREQVERIVDELMAKLLSQSAELRALPAGDQPIAERSAAASK